MDGKLENSPGKVVKNGSKKTFETAEALNKK